jgi:hypothetical protein
LGFQRTELKLFPSFQSTALNGRGSLSASVNADCAWDANLSSR